MNICATYLLFKVFSIGPCVNIEELNDRLANYPLYAYAASQWTYYARKARGVTLSVLKYLQNGGHIGT